MTGIEYPAGHKPLDFVTSLDKPPVKAFIRGRWIDARIDYVTKTGRVDVSYPVDPEVPSVCRVTRLGMDRVCVERGGSPDDQDPA